MRVDETNFEEGYKTLHQDLDLIEKSNHKFDLNFNRGDLVEDAGKNSLSNGIIIACLIGWNELKRSKNIIYYDYGNHAYELIKMNKSNIVFYKVEQYFRKCLNNMRRIKEVNDVTVTDTKNGYNVQLRVTAINDEIVNANFTLLSSYNLLKTNLDLQIDYPDTSPYDNLIGVIKLTDEFGNPITGEICYVYIDDEFITATTETNTEGIVQYVYVPEYLNPASQIRIEYKGSGEYDKTNSSTQIFSSQNWMLKVDNDSNLKLISIEGTEVPEIKLQNGNLIIKDIEENKYILREGDLICQRHL